MKISKKGTIELEHTDRVPIIIPATFSIPKIYLEVTRFGKLRICGKESLIEFKESIYWFERSI